MIEQEGIKIETSKFDQKARIMMVTISGYVDQANCHLLQKTINSCLDEEYFNLVFDFQGLVYMSSAGWGVLIGEIKRFRENGGDIKLACMGPEIYEIYQMLEFYHIISEYASTDEALQSFSATPVAEQPKSVPQPVAQQPANKEPARKAGGRSRDNQGKTKPKNDKQEPEKNAASPEKKKKQPVENVNNGPKAENKTPEKPPVEKPEATPAPVEEVAPEPEEVELNEDVEARDEFVTSDPEAEPINANAPEEELVIEEDIDINIDEILADEGISKSRTPVDKTSYVEFDTRRYSRDVNIKLMPIPDKVRAIIGANPELGAWQIKKMLRHKDYGQVKVGYFKLRGILKMLELDTKEKRYRFYRSA